jgi:hypothetical protein
VQILDKILAGNQDKVKSEKKKSGNEVSHVSVIDLTSEDVVLSLPTSTFIDPVGSAESGREVHESLEDHRVRMALFGYLTRVLAKQSHLLADKAPGDVAGVMTALSTFISGGKAASILQSVRWLVSERAPGTPLQDYLVKLSEHRAFLTANATGDFAFGSRLLREAVLQAVEIDPAFHVETALGRQSNGALDTIINNLTAASLNPQRPDLAANVAMGARGGDRGGRGARGVRGARGARGKGRPPNFVVFADVPPKSCFRYVRKGTCTKDKCPFTHLPATHAAYLAGEYRCDQCMVAHRPGKCTKLAAKLAEGATEGDDDAGELECDLATVVVDWSSVLPLHHR